MTLLDVGCSGCLDSVRMQLNSVNAVKFHIYLEYYPKVHIKSRFTFIKVGESAQYMKNSLIFNFCTIARIDSILLVMKLYET